MEIYVMTIGFSIIFGFLMYIIITINQIKQDSDVTNIKEQFDLSQQKQNEELLRKITKDSAELKLGLNKDISSLKDELTTRVAKENGELRVSMGKNIAENNEKLNKDINEFKNSLNSQIKADFKGLNEEIDKQLTKINNRVEERLNEGFKKTNETFNSVLERITKIDEAQKKIDQLSTDIVDLQSVLTDKKSRGTFGEVQLKQILTSIFGENNKKIFELQKQLSNKNVIDAIIHGPAPLGDICIDSKFPLENYRKMVDRKLPESERSIASKKFKDDVKKHINDISSKYIIPGETSEQAIMFIPAEAVFAEINAYHSDLIEYSQTKKVSITSPTTIMSMLTIVQAILRDIERDKHAKVIQNELGKLANDFSRYKARWDGLSKSIDTVSKRVKEIHTTTDKITNRFDNIQKVKIETGESSEELNVDLIDSEKN